MISSGSDLSGALPFPMGVPEGFLDADFGIPFTEKLRTRDSCEAEEIYRGLRISIFESDSVSVLVRKFDTALGGCICVVGVEGREINRCLGSNGGKEDNAGGRCLTLVSSFGTRGGVAECRSEAGGEGFSDVNGGKEDVDVVGTGGVGVGFALEDGAIELGLEFADCSEACPKEAIEGRVNPGVNVGALGLSAGITEAVTSRLGSEFAGNRLVTGEIIAARPVSWGGGTFNGGEGGL